MCRLPLATKFYESYGHMRGIKVNFYVIYHFTMDNVCAIQLSHPSLPGMVLAAPRIINLAGLTTILVSATGV